MSTIVHPDELEDQQNPRLIAALAYADDGRLVLPLHGPREDGTCDCGKQGCGSPAKHPLTASGVKDATDDESQIRQWWQRWPNANVGLALGELSGVVAFDIDHGDLGLAELLGREMPEGPRQQTGNGEQRLFRWPNQLTKQRLQGTRGWPFQHCDFKGDNTYIVTAPSKHASGRMYQWLSPLIGAKTVPELPGWLRDLVIVKAEPFDLPVAALPDAALDAMHARESMRAASDDTVEAGYEEARDVGLTRAQVRRYATAMYRKGLRMVRDDRCGRNNTMFWLSRQLQSVGMSRRDVVAWVEQFGEEVRYG